MRKTVFAFLKAIGKFLPKSLKLRLLSLRVVRYLCFGKFGVTPFWEDRLRLFMKQIIKPGMTCIDVGANNGEHTKLMAELVGAAGKVFSYEAFPETARVLAEDMKGLDNVTVGNYAVSDGSVDSIPLFAGRNHSSAEWSILSDRGEGFESTSTLNVPSASVDQLVGEVQVDFVKIDVEGAEPMVLNGMRKMLRAAKPVVMIEFHKGAWHGRKALLDAGYTLYDPGGRKIDPASDTRSYHTYAFPPETELDAEAILQGCGPVTW